MQVASIHSCPSGSEYQWRSRPQTEQCSGSVQVASAHANMMFWQTEVLQRQETFTDISKLFTQAQKTQKQGVVPLQALGSYLQAGSDYYTAIRNNLTAKAELEWAIGRDL